MNARDYVEMKNCIDDIVDEFGKIDVLFNNAGALWWNN